MTEEIRKLLGGYATDTLTESERAALFEAALEDQELFDALQNEDALRELLADPVSREQIRLALRPADVGRSPAWWRRGWLVSAASVAVAASIAIAVVRWQRPVVSPALAVQIAQTPIEPKLEAPLQLEAPRKVEKKALRQFRAKREAVAPAPQSAQAINGVAAEAVAPAPLYNGPLVRYLVLRDKDAEGAVRIEVVSQIPGSMALYRANAEGQWQRVYPLNEAGVAIAANTAYRIPDAPISVRDNREKLRLVIEPAVGPLIGGQLTTGSLNAPRAKALDEKATGPAPLIIEIPIGPH